MSDFDVGPIRGRLSPRAAAALYNREYLREHGFETVEEAVMAHEERLIRGRIIFLLTHYPVMNPSMLMHSLGPTVPARAWRPVFQKMVEEGLIKEGVVEAETQLGQFRQLKTISLVRSPASAPKEGAEAGADNE